MYIIVSYIVRIISYACVLWGCCYAAAVSAAYYRRDFPQLDIIYVHSIDQMNAYVYYYNNKRHARRARLTNEQFLVVVQGKRYIQKYERKEFPNKILRFYIDGNVGNFDKFRM